MTEGIVKLETREKLEINILLADDEEIVGKITAKKQFQNLQNNFNQFFYGRKYKSSN